MSSVTSCPAALGFVALASILVACGGSGASDLFAPSAGTGACADCNANDAAARHDEGSPTTGGGGAAGSGIGSTTTGPSGVTSSSATTTSGGNASGGAPGTGGASATGGSGPGGTGGTSDAGPPPADATPDLVVTVDVNAPDQGAVDAIAPRDACVSTGMEVCDGLDNNCNGMIDERGCPDGCFGAARNGVGYYFCTGLNQRRTWQESENDCKNRGMHLVRVDDAEQNAWIRQQSDAHNYNGILWIGGSDLMREGNWVWIDGTQFWMGLQSGHVVGGHFVKWDMGQPNSAEGPEDCGAMWMGTDAWHDAGCANHYGFVCEGTAPAR